MNCLKPKKSIFDFNSNQVQTNLLSSALPGILFPPAIISNPTPIPPVTPAPAPTQAPAPVNTLPTTLSYTGATQGAYKVFQGNQVNFTPTMNQGAVVQSWSITPDISNVIPGLVFNPQTGAITGAPTNLPGANTTYPAFTITATVATFTQNFPIVIELLGTGANVWTVITGVVGQNTSGGLGSLFFHTATNSLYAGGQTAGNLDGVANPFPSIPSAYATKYNLDGVRLWTKIVPRSNGWFDQTGLSIDSSANIIISGQTDNNNMATGTYDGIAVANNGSLGITKFDSNGNKLWTTIKSGSELSANGNVTDSSGNIYTTGAVKNTPFDGVVNTGGQDSAVVLLKFDSNGTQQGSPTLVGSGGPITTSRHNGGSAVERDSLGNLWVVGFSKSSGTCATVALRTTIVLYKFNSSMAYTNCYSLAASANGYNVGTALISDPSNNIYIAGSTEVDLDGLPKISSAGSFRDTFIAKFANNGALLWKRQLAVAGNTSTVANAIVRSPDDFYYITGSTNANLNGEILKGVQDMFIAKYNNAGNLIWVKLIGSAGSTTSGTGLAFDTKNTLYASGTTNGDIGTTVNLAKPNNSMFLTRFVQ